MYTSGWDKYKDKGQNKLLKVLMGKRRGGGGGHKYREKEITKALVQLEQEAEKQIEGIRFMYRDATLPSDVKVLIDGAKYIENPSHLMMLEKEKKGAIKVKRNACPIDKNIVLLDISVKARGPKEDEFFALDP